MADAAKYEIVERDEAGNTTTTYVTSGGSRVDVVYPKRTKSYAQQALDVFLPVGYPQSVTEDYIHNTQGISYTPKDSLQAFSSSIAGMLSSRAVLEGVGVGDASASPTAALLLSVLQESMGRIATILFAHRLGTALEPECKMYRLTADVFNDTAMILDCLSPAFPKPIRVLVLSLSSVLRSLCGVCAGSAKASLSAHFARKGNLGEVNAKDSSQETVVSLLGMLAGSVVVSWVSTPLATWSTLIVLLSIHLATNYAAVKAVSMHSLNRQRANIVFSNILQHGRVLSPNDVSMRERVFERDGVLRWSDDRIMGSCKIGVSTQALLGRIGGQRHAITGSLNLQGIEMSELLHVFAHESYILWYAESHDEVLIILKEGCRSIDQLRAWMHALLLVNTVQAQELGKKLDNKESSLAEHRLVGMRRTLLDARALFENYAGALADKGWDLNVAALETKAGTRAEVDSRQEGGGS